MRQLFGALMLAVCLVAAGAPVALADEGILVLPDGTAKYFKDGKFVGFAVEGPDSEWKRVDTDQSIGKFFENTKEPTGAYRDAQPRAAQEDAGKAK